MVISKRSREIINMSKKLGHIPAGVTMEELRTLKKQSAIESRKRDLKLKASIDDFDKKPARRRYTGKDGRRKPIRRK